MLATEDNTGRSTTGHGFTVASSNIQRSAHRPTATTHPPAAATQECRSAAGAEKTHAAFLLLGGALFEKKRFLSAFHQNRESGLVT
ncbi:hypothetical protein MTO96_048528 [Rhipicephalus appendiculatus]